MMGIGKNPISLMLNCSYLFTVVHITFVAAKEREALRKDLKFKENWIKHESTQLASNQIL